MTAPQPEDVAGRVLAALDAWEAAAKRVNTGQWYPWDDRNGDLSAALQGLNSKAGEHIAANDPAHVLRVVEALQTVVRLHACEDHSRIAPEFVCAVCVEDYPCATVRAVAAIWPGEA